METNEVSQTPFSSKMSCADIISSWLEDDDIYTPAFPEEHLDMHLLDDNFLQFGQPDFQTDHFSQTNPPQYDSNNDSDSFLLDLSNFNADPATTESSPYRSLLPDVSTVAEAHSTHSAALIEGADSDCFLNDQLCLPAPGESRKRFLDHVLGSIWTPATTSSSEVNPLTLDTTNVGPIQNEEDEQEGDYPTCDDWKPGALNCKNLVSERNRRKRLSQQLLALRALVPNITKMDRRSVLVDALAYLKSIHEETAQIQAELKERSSSSSSSSSSSRYSHRSLQRPPVHKNSEALVSTLVSTQMLAPLPPRSSFKPRAHILEIDTEKTEDRRFVVKIKCKGGAGVGGEVLRVIESLGFAIIYMALEHIKPLHVLTTIFIKVRKQSRMTEERLKSSITSTALRSGLKLQNP